MSFSGKKKKSFVMWQRTFLSNFILSLEESCALTFVAKYQIVGYFTQLL